MHFTFYITCFFLLAGISSRASRLPVSSSHSDSSPRSHSATRTYSVRGYLRHGSELMPTSTGNVVRRDLSPTPTPTGPSMLSTTVHIQDSDNFAILLPQQGSGLSIGDSEDTAVAYCYGSGGCSDQPPLPDGFILAMDVTSGGDDDESWIQITGCMNSTSFGLDPSDGGGQYDSRYPNGAQCTFGGYGASFIEQVEPDAQRFCLRCCTSPNDQTNCNSHEDTSGCPTAIPGKYDFPELNISCS